MGSTEMEAGMEEIPVKVAVRIRPLLSKEVLDNHQVCVRLVPNTQQIIIGKDRTFTFDFVFGKASTQGEVYTVCIKPLLQSLTEGYNATVLAYGQTGSGKTYTIGGGHIASISEEEKGIIPRAIQELFQHISENHNVDFHVKVSYIEVYKEELYDLLELETSVKDLHIREDEKGNTVIVGAKEFQVECADEVMSLLKSGNAARHTGITQKNEHSSRSHAIFTISICQKQSAESQKNTDVLQDPSCKSVRMIASKFHFVDLAGSERVTKTGNTGERFKESIQINSGLLALGNVISALGDPKRKSVHIPYRDAKITHILKDSLGGNAKSVLITCISPSSSDFDESLNSLKYANRAKNIRNKPVVNYNSDQDQIDEMRLEIRLLREALQSQQVSNQCPHDLSQERIQISSLEEQLTQVQAQCLSYRNCMDEAFLFLVALNDDVSLKKSQRERLQSWITMMQEVRKEDVTVQQADTRTGTSEEPHHFTALQLQRELKKCQQALITNEEIFSQQDHELMILQSQIKALIQEKKEHLESLKKVEETQRLQIEKMVEQQILIDQLKGKLEKFTVVKTLDMSSTCEDETAVVASARRPYSVLLTKNLLHLRHPPSGTDTPKVYTSPPAFSLDWMMARFRARSQMILSCIEDQDEVLHCHLSDQSDDEGENTHSKKKTSFKHSRNCTQTQKQASLCFPLELGDMKRQVENSSPSNKSVVQNDTPTGKDAQSISRKYTKLEQESEQAKTELAETQKQLQELESKELRDVPEKARLQRELQKKVDAAKLKVQEVQLKMEQQQKSLNLKDEEITVFKKKNNHSTGTSHKSEKSEEQKKCLDEEMERILQQHRRLAELEEDLKKREAIIAKKEALLQEKGHLETEKLRSSQEERILFQWEEGTAALEAATDENKNENIQDGQHLPKSSQILSQSEDNIIGKLVSLSAAELRAILFRYVNKVVGLCKTERKLQLQTEEQGMKVGDQENIIRELESAVENIKLQCDRQLTLKHREHEKKLQLILHHLKEQDGEGTKETLKEYEVKVQQLEKELFFYKKTSRDLKKKLKSLQESSHRLVAPTKCNSVGDKASSQAEVASEEFKLKANSQAGKIKEAERTNILRAPQNLYKLGEDVSEFGCNKECLSSTVDDRQGEEAQPPKSQFHLPSVIQRREAVTQFQGATPVKVSRRELRRIPASELSSRLSSLGAGASVIAPDSIAMDKM
ncbi:kinesin-like protein KIF27 [Cyrtonyx montezumae]|uniref:kinesin-like protein KIF27 n=1 Tax=Cyrtonyx montezumae TaxID=9017 RepID=UPI0032D9E0F3